MWHWWQLPTSDPNLDDRLIGLYRMYSMWQWQLPTSDPDLDDGLIGLYRIYSMWHWWRLPTSDSNLDDGLIGLYRVSCYLPVTLILTTGWLACTVSPSATNSSSIYSMWQWLLPTSDPNLDDGLIGLYRIYSMWHWWRLPTSDSNLDDGLIGLYRVSCYLPVTLILTTGWLACTVSPSATNSSSIYSMWQWQLPTSDPNLYDGLIGLYRVSCYLPVTLILTTGWLACTVSPSATNSSSITPATVLGTGTVVWQRL